MCQAGYSEAWLRSIFSTLPDDLSHALRDAWHATMILHRMNSLTAQDSLHNRTRMAVAASLGFNNEVQVNISTSRSQSKHLYFPIGQKGANAPLWPNRWLARAAA